MKVDCQWGRTGAAQPADVSIIVDVLSFSTSVTVAAERGARVFPFWGEAGPLAALVGARAASKQRTAEAISLSPASLMRLQPGEAVVLPSPNGARCALAARAEHVLCGCLRNAAAVAELALRAGGDVLVVPAGEQWPDGSLRVAYEDMVGAGAIIAHLGGELTPEAGVALAAFTATHKDLATLISASPSGRELIERGFAEDVAIAAELNVCDAAPIILMHRSRYRAVSPEPDMASSRVRYFEDAGP